MSAHTPGPWDCDSDDEHIVADAGNPTQRIATVTMFLPEYREESVANARLIAAAPELLEVCAAWVQHMDGNEASTQEREDGLLHAMRTAIAKAEGRS